MTKTYDIAFTQEDDGTMLLHKANCPIARQRAADGHPVATLLGCEYMPSNIKQCSCMTADERPEIWSKK